MKPISLYIEGFQSFIQGHEIDFETLSKGGLFGIFGSTGSGKSTILDAIIVSLYGSNSIKKEQRDFINKTLDKACIKFVFKSGGETYTVVRTFRIRKSGTMDNTAFFYKSTEAGQLTLADNIKNADSEIEKIIGLTCEEFKKCVILPQGEFASFIKSQRGERLKIIGSLFNLEHYGESLYQKTAYKINEEDCRLKAAESAINAVIGDVEGINVKQEEQKIILKKENAAQLEKEITAAGNSIKIIESNIEKNKEVAKAKAAVDELIKQKEYIDNLEKEAAHLKKAAAIIPVINDYINTENELNKNKSALKSYENLLKQLNAEQEKAQSNFNNAEKEFNDNSENLNVKIHALKTLLPDAQTLKTLKEKRIELLKQYENAEKQLAQKSQYLENEKSQLSIVNSAIYDTEKKYDFEKLLGKSFLKGGIEEIDNAIIYLKKCYPAALPYFEQRKQDKQKRVNDTADIDFEGFKESLVILKELKERQGTFQKNINSLTAETALLKERLLNIKNGGIDAKGDIENIEKKFSNLGINENITSQNIEKIIKELSAKLEIIVSNKEKCQKQCEQIKNNITEQQSEYKQSAAVISELEKQLAVKAKALQDSLEKYGIENINEVKGINTDKDYIIKLEEKVMQYRIEFASAQNTYQNIRQTAFEVDYEKYQSLKNEYNLKYEEYKKIIGEIASQQQKLQTLKENIVKIEKYKKDANAAKNKLNSLNILSGLVKGKSFMEYAAEEYIQEVTLHASSYTSKLTSGKFALVYDNGNFLVVDNFSGGELRPVNTLSGGETFLISLSLAVALSESIVKMSDKPVEFFFLDEGFGTLDRELCDTVMNTLEKLKQTHFTIGIISHVPELMHRLTYKLMLTPPNGNNKGTSVQLVY